MAGKKQFGPVLEAVLTANITNFQRNMLKSQQILQTMSGKFKKLGTKMSLAVTVPLAAMAVASVKAFADFDEAMTRSTAIMTGMTTEMRDQMEKTALSLSTTGVQSATDLAEAYFFLASAGMSAEQAISALPIVQQFATAGAFDMATATDLLTDAQTALGLSSKDTAENEKNLIKLGDILVRANTLANASVQQFSESLTNDAAVAMQGFGLEVEEGVAILATYANQGIKGNVAGSLLGRGLRLLTAASRDNAAAFEKMNIQVVGRDGEYRSFIEIIKDMETAFEGLTRPQRDAALEELGFAARVQKAITPLLGHADATREMKEELENSTGYMKSVADKQMEAFSSQVKMLWSRFTKLRIEIGTFFIPALKSMMKVIGSMFDFWEGLSSTTKKWLVGLAAVVATVGPVLIALAFLSKAVLAVGFAIAALTSNPVHLAIAGVAASLTLLMLAMEGGEEQAKKLDEALAKVGAGSDMKLPPKMGEEEAANMFGSEKKDKTDGARNERVQFFSDLQGKWQATLNLKAIDNSFNRIAETGLMIGKIFGRVATDVKDIVTGAFTNDTKFSTLSTFQGNTATQELGAGFNNTDVQQAQLDEARKAATALENIDKRGRRTGYENEALVVGDF